MKSSVLGIYILIIASLTFPSLYGQESSKREIQKLENDMAFLEKSQRIEDEALNSKIINLEQRLSLANDKVTLYSWGIPITSLIAFISLVYALFQWIKKWMKERLKKHSQQLLESRSLDFEQMLKNASLENKVRREKRIFVLSPSKEVEDEHRNSFDSLNLERVEFKVVSTYEKFHKPEPDLIVFNHFDDDLIKEFLQYSSSEAFFVHYTKPRAYSHDRIAFANTPFTLFTAILGVFRFQEVRREKYGRY